MRNLFCQKVRTEFRWSVFPLPSAWALSDAHKKDIMRRETDQHGRGRREATEDRMDPCGKRESGQQKKGECGQAFFGIGVGEALGRLGGALDRRKPAADNFVRVMLRMAFCPRRES